MNPKINTTAAAAAYWLDLVNRMTDDIENDTLKGSLEPDRADAFADSLVGLVIHWLRMLDASGVDVEHHWRELRDALERDAHVTPTNGAHP